MNYRFKFRCGITVSHYDEDGNDIETKVMFNAEALFDDNTIGIGYDKLKSVVDELHLSDEKLKTLWDYLYEYEVTEDWFNFHNPDFIEQCTGLKDKNGRLIYEGDICIPAKDMADKAGEVYRAESGAYFIKGIMKSGMEYDFGIYYNHYMYEVIGNIHENHYLVEE